MLKRISRIKDFRIFRDFSWPQQLEDFSRFNIIYGLNGTGKTTFSTMLRHVERRQPIADGTINFVFDKRSVSGTDLGAAALPMVKVFNRDFVDRAVFETGGQYLPPVYYFGEDSAEKQRKIVELTNDLKDSEAEQARHSAAAKSAGKALEDYCTEVARSIRNLLTVTGGGPYNNYNAQSFKQQALRVESQRSSLAPLALEQRDQYMSLRESKALPYVSPVEVKFPDLLDLRLRVQNLVRTSVVSSLLEDLAADPAIASWVGSGLALHSGERHTETCRFCQQPLERGRLDQIESHFNDEFKLLKQRIADLILEVERAQAFGESMVLPPAEALYDQFRAPFAEACSNLRSQCLLIRGALDALKSALLAKQDDPFQPIELETWLKLVGPGKGFGHAILAIFAAIAEGAQLLASSSAAKALERANSLISQHNQLTASFDVNVKTARDALAQDEVLGALEGWSNRSRELNDATADEESARLEAGRLRKEIADLEASVRQHHQPAEELNRELAAYLGRSELSFVPDQNGYRLMRGDQSAQHLSDGERTAVAFMYFLKALQGTDFELSEGIVVIDDPISSLDANSLFSAFGYMKARTANAKQLFILTHNFSFFRQVHNWFKHIKPKARYLTLQATLINGKRGAALADLDSFLTSFESEYQYLFKRVYEVSQLAQGQGLESYYGMPNIARRLLESFLAYRVPGHSGDLFKKLGEIDGEIAMKTRILRFLHTFSHGDAVATPDHDPSVLAETQAIFKDVLDLMRANDDRHVAAMIQLCDSTG